MEACGGHGAGVQRENAVTANNHFTAHEGQPGARPQEGLEQSKHQGRTEGDQIPALFACDTSLQAFLMSVSLEALWITQLAGAQVPGPCGPEADTCHTGSLVPAQGLWLEEPGCR